MFIFINKFVVTGDVAEFKEILAEINAYMKRQPGFQSHRLYQSAKDSNVYVEIAEWEEATLHKQATSSDEFLVPVRKIMKLADAEPGPFTLVGEHVAAE